MHFNLRCNSYRPILSRASHQTNTIFGFVCFCNKKNSDLYLNFLYVQQLRKDHTRRTVKDDFSDNVRRYKLLRQNSRLGTISLCRLSLPL
jgi:hypothetical protein